MSEEEIIIDAKGESLGRIASRVASILNGKSDLDYMPNRVTQKRVKVINLNRAVVTGRKLEQKRYYRHSGFPGALKSKLMGEVKKDNPTKLFLGIVSGMIPRNRLRDKKLKNLVIEG